LSNEDLEARAWFANRIEEAGFLVHDDEVGNLSGVLLCDNPGARTLLLGSHLDTVRNGGKYDGSVGVLVSLEILRTIRDAGIKLPFHLEPIDFTDEEGTWHSFFGSLGLVGDLTDASLNGATQDNSGFRAALFRAGIRPSEAYRARRSAENLLGYLELHIEQSERLERAGTQIGIVSSIVGRSAHHFIFYGEAAHAATTLLEKRRDALQGAAIFITEMHKMVQEEYPEGIVNCGNVHVEPGTFSIVPEQASLRVECRHPDEDVLAEIESRLIRLAQDCAKQYRLSVNVKTALRRPAARMDAGLRQMIEEACKTQHCSYAPILGYAGHDAQILSRITPAAMIFLPSHDGVSHN
ncbi:MAG: hydantoinase/carbamoylase family amidase, partial [Anaerolineae bacterium]|nr:hydantoinase/carbamoylase family amidase [Anaerolineae bacterium]